MPMRFPEIVGVAACSVLLACANATDSRVPCADSTARRYEDVPLLSLGKVEPLPDATVRGLIQAGVLDYSVVAPGGNGALLLLDPGSSHLAVLDSAGRLLHAGGAKGRGPGEIGVAMGAARVRADSFVVLDRTNARLLLLGADGGPGRTVSTVAAAAGGIATLAGALGPDSVLIMHQQYGLSRADGLSTDSLSLRIVSIADGGVRSLGSVLAGRSFKRSATQRFVSIPVPVDARTSVLATAGRLFIARGTSMQVDVMSTTGDRRPGFCLSYRSPQVTDDLIAADRATDRPISPMTLRLRADAHAAGGARAAPAIREFVALDDSTLAVRRWTPRKVDGSEYLLVRIGRADLLPYARIRLSGQQQILGRLGAGFLVIDTSADEPTLLRTLLPERAPPAR